MKNKHEKQTENLIFYRTNGGQLSPDYPEACKFLRISARTLARLRASGSIPYIKSHRKILYSTSDLSEYLDRNKCREKMDNG